MSPTFLFLFCVGAFVSLLPLTVYCLVLGYVNNRPHPTMSSGIWDFVYALLGLSGFIVVGGPLLLTALDSVWRAAWLRGDFAHLRGVLGETRDLWLRIWAGYFLLLLLGIAWALLLRRRTTVVYHIDADQAREVLVGAIESTGRICRADATGVIIPATPGARHSRTGWIELLPFRATRHVTLRWYDVDPKTRREVEQALDRVLQDTPSPANPTSGWMVTIASFLFFLMLFNLLLAIIILWGGD